MPDGRRRDFAKVQGDSMDLHTFASSLRERTNAARKLEQGLLTEVPMLYGSPGSLEPEGDPGIVIARMHQQELQRRSGGGVYQPRTGRSDVTLPFEKVTGTLAIALFVLFVFFG